MPIIYFSILFETCRYPIHNVIANTDQHTNVGFVYAWTCFCCLAGCVVFGGFRILVSLCFQNYNWEIWVKSYEFQKMMPNLSSEIVNWEVRCNLFQIIKFWVMYSNCKWYTCALVNFLHNANKFISIHQTLEGCFFVILKLYK
jgi:hypothetical protein